MSSAFFLFLPFFIAFVVQWGVEAPDGVLMRLCLCWAGLRSALQSKVGFRLSRKKGEEEGRNEVMAAAAAEKEGENVFSFRVLGEDEGRGGGGKKLMVCQPESIERSLEAAANFGSGGLSLFFYFWPRMSERRENCPPPPLPPLLSSIFRATNVRRFFPLLFQLCLPVGHFLTSVWIEGGQWKNKIPLR